MQFSLMGFATLLQVCLQISTCVSSMLHFVWILWCCVYLRLALKNGNQLLFVVRNHFKGQLTKIQKLQWSNSRIEFQCFGQNWWKFTDFYFIVVEEEILQRSIKMSAHLIWLIVNMFVGNLSELNLEVSVQISLWPHLSVSVTHRPWSISEIQRLKRLKITFLSSPHDRLNDSVE